MPYPSADINGARYCFRTPAISTSRAMRRYVLLMSSWDKKDSRSSMTRHALNLLVPYESSLPFHSNVLLPTGSTLTKQHSRMYTHVCIVRVMYTQVRGTFISRCENGSIRASINPRIEAVIVNPWSFLFCVFLSFMSRVFVFLFFFFLNFFSFATHGSYLL